FDYLLTLDLELRFIWHSRWSIIKVLFLLARYSPFIDMSVAFICTFRVTSFSISAHFLECSPFFFLMVDFQTPNLSAEKCIQGHTLVGCESKKSRAHRCVRFF
ncbi:hypothetical protein AMATHDRAFT_153814, partial [Amanita thiersii Skay4041]